MGELFTLFLGAAIINNIILTRFLGMCPFLGVSKKSDSALGMGAAVTFVIVVSSIVTYFLYHNVLVLLGLEYMDLITFILVIACFVQFTELFLKKFSPALYDLTELQRDANKIWGYSAKQTFYLKSFATTKQTLDTFLTNKTICIQLTKYIL